MLDLRTICGPPTDDWRGAAHQATKQQPERTADQEQSHGRLRDARQEQGRGAPQVQSPEELARCRPCRWNHRVGHGRAGNSLDNGSSALAPRPTRSARHPCPSNLTLPATPPERQRVQPTQPTPENHSHFAVCRNVSFPHPRQTSPQPRSSRRRGGSRRGDKKLSPLTPSCWWEIDKRRSGPGKRQPDSLLSGNADAPPHPRSGTTRQTLDLVRKPTCQGLLEGQHSQASHHRGNPGWAPLSATVNPHSAELMSASGGRFAPILCRPPFTDRSPPHSGISLWPTVANAGSPSWQSQTRRNHFFRYIAHSTSHSSTKTETTSTKPPHGPSAVESRDVTARVTRSNGISPGAM